MLILTRRLGESICLYPQGSEGDSNQMTVIKIAEFIYSKNKDFIYSVRLGIQAPPDIAVHRSEIYHKILNEKQLKLDI